MSRMPGAEWQGEEHGSRLMDRYDIVCIHTIVGYAPAHAAHFSTTGAGELMQSRDTRFRSAANFDGNHRIIAIENADHGPEFPKWAGSDVPPLTDNQIDRCAEVLAWAHIEHGIPLQLCPDSRPGSRGLAYHRQGIDGNFESYRFPGRRTGGEVWTEHRGKVCPGDRRIAQLPIILARAQDILEGDDMAFTDEDRARAARIEDKLDDLARLEKARAELNMKRQQRIVEIRDAITKGDASLPEIKAALDELADQV